MLMRLLRTNDLDSKSGDGEILGLMHDIDA